MFRKACAAAALVLALAVTTSSQTTAPDWPSFNATYVLEPVKTAGGEITDPFWLHLHHGGPPEELAFSLGLIAWSEDLSIPSNRDIPLTSLPPGHEIRYTVRGIAVSPWLPVTAANHTVRIDDPALATLKDGIHDLSLDVRGPQRHMFQPLPMFLHVHRHLEVEPTVPIIGRDDNGRVYAQDRAREGPGVVYVNVADRRVRAYPANPNVTPWHLPPHEQPNLYVEELSPHSNLFMAQQMWWEEPPGTGNAGLKFVRALRPKYRGEDARTLYDEWGSGNGPVRFGYQGQRTFPFRDGPRGIGWASPFITGQVDSTGGFAFVEAGGPLRYMKPDGEIITVAGWRVRPDKDPVWILKPLTSIRQNMELRGTWVSGQYSDQSGFRLPLDVAIDPKNENVWYVASFHDHAIWKVEILDRTTFAARVSIFAGDPNHAYGFVDGTGWAARFKGPHSLVFDPVSDSIYVADQDNDAIRRITRSGQVTTLFGGPGFAQRVCGMGASDCREEIMYDTQTHSFNRADNRRLGRFVVNADDAARGVRPDIYVPYTIRVDSRGNLVVLDIGFGSIRRINPATGETKLLGEVSSTFDRGYRGWVWLDVDRWGNSGPKDGIYYCVAVASSIDGEPDRHANEVFAWIPPEGGAGRWVFGYDSDDNPDGWGLRERTDAPHYPWLVAVDPRGALLVSGIGEHGISRMRMRRPSDPVPSNYSEYYAGKQLWGRLINPATRRDFSPGRAVFSLKFGHGGHNTLGFADAWGMAGKSDAEIIQAFEIPESIRNSPEDLRILLNFIRLNSGAAGSASNPSLSAPSAPTNVRIIR